MKTASAQAVPIPVPAGASGDAPASSALAKEAVVPPEAPSPPAVTKTVQLPIIQPQTPPHAQHDNAYNEDILSDDTDDNYYNLRRFLTGNDDNGKALPGYAQPRTRAEAVAQMEAEIAACLDRLADP